MKQTVTERVGRKTQMGATAMLGAVLALVFSVFMAAAPAGAATSVMNFTMTGSTQFSGQPVQNFPSGSGFSGTVDDTSGAVTNGAFTIPAYDVVVSGVTIHVTISDTAKVTGNINPTTGVATLNAHPKVTLFIAAASATCVLGPFTVVLKTSNAGGHAFTGNPLKGTLTANGYTIPAIAATGSCASLAATINTALGLPTTNTHQTSVLTATNQAVTTTTAAPTTTVAPTTTAAAAVSGNANFTG